ncbi:UvrD-helicase domain-containing protein [Aquibacillus sediminis]|uniref:UvrD-helicase domain-containing protein n=1 Tax=Aquibacillus sediminis TaxID=2574734 RepID=UPI001107EF79|nr:UvrD-helicase domain-containing protein [Aquibacillus sediminis]
MTKTNEFHILPHGAKHNNVKSANFADQNTTVDLVMDHEEDAFFFRSLEQNGIKLNQPQLEAVRHFAGAALVLAGAGSGKTRVLISRTGYLISVKKVHPKKIMLVTFTRKASEEMKQRISQLPGLSFTVAQTITIGTFHSIFLRLLRSRGYHQQILSNEKRKQVAIKIILKDKGLQDSYEPETLLAILSDYKNNIQSIDDIPSKSTVDKEIKSILQAYERWKQEHGLLDFDDILLETYHLLLRDPKLLKAMQTRFDYILCDEWQDTNPIQFALIQLIAKPTNNLFVVGDDDQTIYSFNGADRSIILNFESHYPSTKVITLDINYRSTASIIGLANQVIDYNKDRNKKQLLATKTSEHPPYYLRPSNTDEEAKQIIKKITEEVEQGHRSYNDFAILHRTNSSSRAIFDLLVLEGIPFLSFTKGETFYEQALVKPVIDYMRIALNPVDMAAYPSILPTMYINRDFGFKHIETNQLLEPKQQPLEHLLTMTHLKPFQKKQIEERLKIIKQIKAMKPIQAVKKIRSFYDEYLEANETKNLTMHKEMILETLSEMEASANKFDTITDFINFIDQVIEKNKEMETIRRTPDANAISLMTIHRAKGLEYPVIFLAGASEGILPHSSAIEASDKKDLISINKGSKKVEAAIEEERRLMYVAITRAVEELYISSPSYYRGEPAEESRFILDPFTPADQQKKQPKHGVWVWECSKDTCICWMRMESKDEINQETRECPMCKADMVKTKREI